MVFRYIICYGIGIYLLSAEIEIHSLVSALYRYFYFCTGLSGYLTDCVIDISGFLSVDLQDYVFRHQACSGSRSVIKDRHDHEVIAVLHNEYSHTDEFT